MSEDKLKATDRNAFPWSNPSLVGSPQYGGMTLRDYFAGQFIAGAAALKEFHVEYYKDPDREAELLAKQAYRIADAMLFISESNGCN